MSCWKNVGAKPFAFKLNGIRYSVEAGASVSIPDAYDYAISHFIQHSSAQFVPAPDVDYLAAQVAEALEVKTTEVELTPVPDTNGNVFFASAPKPKKKTKPKPKG